MEFAKTIRQATVPQTRRRNAAGFCVLTHIKQKVKAFFTSFLQNVDVF